MRKIILLIMLVMFLINFVPAQDISETTLGTYKTATEIELVQICNNATALCDSCNVTSVKYPNSSIILSNGAMTSSNNEFNLTLTTTQTIPLGEYIVSGFCISGDERKVWSYNLFVNNSGRELTTSQGIIYVIFLLGCAIFQINIPPAAINHIIADDGP